MGTLGKILLGFFVGVLCGLIPLIYGFLSSHKIIAVIGLASSIVTGSIFSLAGKSPFIAMIMSTIFVIFLYATNKRAEEHNLDDEEDI